jgi:hypothetical protein
MAGKIRLRSRPPPGAGGEIVADYLALHSLHSRFGGFVELAAFSRREETHDFISPKSTAAREEAATSAIAA